MKTFDLKAALDGEPVVTRDGRKVVQIAHFPSVSDGYRLEVLVSGDCRSRSYWDSGKYSNGDNALDLFMASKPVKVWLNLYHVGSYFSSAVHTSEESANMNGPLDRIGGKAWPSDL